MTNTKVNLVNSKHKYRPQESSGHRPKSTTSRQKVTPVSGHKNKCNRCGRLHNKDKSKCPAANQRCHSCGMLGHFAVMCKNKRKVRHLEANPHTVITVMNHQRLKVVRKSLCRISCY